MGHKLWRKYRDGNDFPREEFATIPSLLKHPDNTITTAPQGWTCLEEASARVGAQNVKAMREECKMAMFFQSETVMENDPDFANSGSFVYRSAVDGVWRLMIFEFFEQIDY